jgi:hypothetical protein
VARDAVSAEPRATVPKEQSHAPAWILLAVGVWLPLASLVLGYADEARDAVFVECLLGASLIWFAAWKLTGRSLANGAPTWCAGIGVLLLIAPEVVQYGYGNDRVAIAAVNSNVMGVLAIAASIWMGRRQKKAGV